MKLDSGPSRQELLARTAEFGDDYLRLYISEPSRAGLVDEVRAALPNAVHVRIDPQFAAVEGSARRARLDQHSPQQLFAAFCDERAVSDQRVAELFARLHDEAAAGDPAAAIGG